MKKYILTLASMMMFLSGCSLKEEMDSYTTTKNYYNTPSECLTGLNGCYNDLRSIIGNRLYFLTTECQSDIMTLNRVDQRNAILQITPANPEFAETIWKYGYQGVMKTNSVLAAIDRAGFSEAEKVPLRAEGKVLRAMFYYLLTINFGDVPFYEEEVVDSNSVRIAQLPRMSASVTRNTMIEELQECLLKNRALDFKRTNDEGNLQRYRCGAALGLMIGGKMCLWEERWADAIDFFGALEDIYGNGKGVPEGALDKYPLADVKFTKHLSDEAILEINNISVDFGLHQSGTLAGICTPVRSVNSEEGEEEEEDINDAAIYQGIKIPELGSAARTQTPVRPTPRFYAGLMPYSSSDHRKAEYDAAGGQIKDSGGYLAWGWVGYAPDEDPATVEPKFRYFNGVSSTSKPYLGNKFWCFGMQYTSDSNCYRFFRFAGALLGLAEAWYQKGDMEMACRYLNSVKTRAGLDPVNPGQFMSHEDIFTEIQDENARELFGEFQRKHDLVRWGNWYEMTVKYNAGPKNTEHPAEGGDNNTRLMQNIKPCHRYLPIPAAQVTYSNYALDNKEYKYYGL